MNLATRCPSCGTIFRIVQDQLRVSQGWVRCGRCGEAFNAVEAMVDLPPPRVPLSTLPDNTRAAGIEATTTVAASVAEIRDPVYTASAADPAASAAPPSEHPDPASVPCLTSESAAPADGTPDTAGDVRSLDKAMPLNVELRLPLDGLEASREAGSDAVGGPVGSPVGGAATEESSPAFDLPVMDRIGSESVAPAETASTLIDVPPGVEVIATDGAITAGFGLPPGSTRGTAGPPEANSGDPASASDTAAVRAGPTTSALDADIAADTGSTARGAAVLADAIPAHDAPPSFVLAADRAARWRRPGVRLALGLAALAALLGLAGQVIYAFRDRIAATQPNTRPWLAQACMQLGCRVGEYRQLDALSVESTGLTRVDGAPVYRLAVTLKNRATVEVAAPAIDLSLTDAQGKPIARRVLTMTDLNLPLRSLKPGSELPIQVPLSIGDKTVAGYTVELFYP